eukprot:TRINITY_DN37818_c0_g1_i1.p2 TRINITY_DN37818_c0_g1~~TRINITY_DN37818_c0_g1_i1.p2  ORF type:complete len:113 (+),score=25.51 TRINITY_DN37818_c0_g1_i1:117-455(+)
MDSGWEERVLQMLFQDSKRADDSHVAMTVEERRWRKQVAIRAVASGAVERFGWLRSPVLAGVSEAELVKVAKLLEDDDDIENNDNDNNLGSAGIRAQLERLISEHRLLTACH